MKIEFTDRGMSLIILMGIIVAVGIIGAGIVSFMDVKQRSYPVQVQSYQALNLANAGAEFAIRYANDRYVDAKQSAQDSLGLPKTISFGSGNCGTFTIQYIGGADYTLKSLGVCGNAQREVRITKFAGYVQGSGLILTEVVDSNYPPTEHSHDASVPITNTFDQDIYIKYMEVTLNSGQGSKNLIAGVYLDSMLVYDPATDKTNPNYVSHKDTICIPTLEGSGCDTPAVTPAKIPFAFNFNLRIPPGSFTQLLNFSSGSVGGTYTIKLYFDFDTNYNNLQTATMSFTI
jgi:hypothetical protein